MNLDPTHENPSHLEQQNTNQIVTKNQNKPELIQEKLYEKSDTTQHDLLDKHNSQTLLSEDWWL